MKPYPPIMREKRRYIQFKLICDSKASKKEVISALWDNAFEYIGVLGAVDSSFWVMDFDEEKQQGIVRCDHLNVEKILGILGFLNKVSNKKATIHIIGVTGTIKKAKTLSELQIGSKKLSLKN